MEGQGDSPPGVTKAVQPSRRTTQRKPSIGEKATSAIGAIAMILGTGTGSVLSRDVLQGVRDDHPVSTTDHHQESQIQSPLEKQTSNEDLGDKSAFDIVFHDLPQEESRSARSMVDDEKQRWISQGIGEHNLQQVLARMKELEPLIRQAAKNHNVPFELLAGLVMTESLGDPNAESSVEAVGLLQFMPETALDAGLELEPLDQRKDPELSLEKGAQMLRKAYEQFGDWGFAFWSWHMGEGNLYKHIRNYFIYAHGQDPGEVYPQGEIKPEDLPQINRQREKYKKIIIENNLTVFHLINDDQLSKDLQGESWDSTTLYLVRVVAGWELISQDTPQASENLG